MNLIITDRDIKPEDINVVINGVPYRLTPYSDDAYAARAANLHATANYYKTLVGEMVEAHTTDPQKADQIEEKLTQILCRKSHA